MDQKKSENTYDDRKVVDNHEESTYQAFGSDKSKNVSEWHEKFQVIVPVRKNPVGNEKNLKGQIERSDPSVKAQNNKKSLVIQTNAGAQEKTMMIMFEDTTFA